MKEMKSFSKMALMAEPTMFHIGEVVGYRERVCLVKSITATNHGFNTFELEDIDEDVVYVAYKHELVKAIDLPALSLGQEGEFAEILVRPMPEGAVPTAEAAVPDSAPLDHPVSNPAATGGRFVRLTAAEVDSVASARTAKNTNEQTKWGTKIFKGKLFICVLCIFVVKMYLDKLQSWQSTFPTVFWSDQLIECFHWQLGYPRNPEVASRNENEAPPKLC